MVTNEPNTLPRQKPLGKTKSLKKNKKTKKEKGKKHAISDFCRFSSVGLTSSSIPFPALSSLDLDAGTTARGLSKISVDCANTPR